MPRITIPSLNLNIACETGANLLSVLQESKVPVANPCNGHGTCGKCKVRLLSGSLHTDAEREQRLLAASEERDGWHLACTSSVEQDITLSLAEAEHRHNVLDGGFVPDFVRDEKKSGYGLAVDIGTTTVVLSLVDLSTGAELAKAVDINNQKRFGLDVLTRITYEYEQGEKAIGELQACMVSQLNALGHQACAKAGISPSDVHAIHVAAHCAMLHLLLGVDARSLGRYPYTPVFTEAKTIPASDIGLRFAPTASLYCLPQVSAYIGADIVAGAYVCQLHRANDTVLFIDIGTNGEMVLASEGKLRCCSCAAGPALEGMNISGGMRAAEGAIEDIVVDEAGITLSVMGNVPPKGICGSGILACVKELLSEGFLQKSGAFIKSETLAENDWRGAYLESDGVKRHFLLSRTPRILITQNDVRQVQLAKGALLSGIMTLLDIAGITAAHVDRVLVAGQFGAHLPEESLIGAGILPPETKGKITYVGNSSKTGAMLSLLSASACEQMEKLAQHMDYFELAKREDYDDLFARCMMF